MKTRVLTLTTITLLALPSIAQERGQKRDQPERKKGELENVEKRIKSAVERGDITKEEAKAKFAEVKKMMEKKRNAEQKSDKPNFESIERRLKEGVKRGDLTEEQAKAKFAEMKKMMEKKRNTEQKSDKPNFESIERRLKEGVKRGDLTEEQAKAKFAEMKKMMEKKRNAAGKTERPISKKEFAERMKQEQMRKHPEAVERAKKMRHELELKKREAANNKRNEQTDHQKRREHEEREQQERRKHEEREHHEHNHTERQLDEAREHAERQRERHHHARFDAIEKSLHQAVEAGLISGLEAQKTMAKLHLAAIKHQQKKERR